MVNNARYSGCAIFFFILTPTYTYYIYNYYITIYIPNKGNFNFSVTFPTYFVALHNDQLSVCANRRIRLKNKKTGQRETTPPESRHKTTEPHISGSVINYFFNTFRLMSRTSIIHQLSDYSSIPFKRSRSRAVSTESTPFLFFTGANSLLLSTSYARQLS